MFSKGVFPRDVQKRDCMVKGLGLFLGVNADFRLYKLASLTHYQTTNFRFFQTERVCRRQFQISRKWQKTIQTVRKHCGKRRNCSLRAISPFPTVFSEGLFPRGVKRCLCGNGLKKKPGEVSITIFK